MHGPPFKGTGSIQLRSGIKIHKPVPKFQTNQNLLGAIDVCIQQSENRCSVFHLTTKGVFLDNRTSRLAFFKNNDGDLTWAKEAYRTSYTATFLQTLNITKNVTMVIYHADTLPPNINRYPIIAHTVRNHSEYILFPTPYMLKDLQSGEIEKTMKYCNNPEMKQNITNLENRLGNVYFRGHYRNNFRLSVKLHYRNGDDQLGFDVEFTALPNDLKDNLTVVPQTSWTKKFNHQYLLTLRGGYSSQWGVYKDYISRGVIIREQTDRLEYWNYDLVHQHSSQFVSFAKVADIKSLILVERVQTCKQYMANFTSEAALPFYSRTTFVVSGKNLWKAIHEFSQTKFITIESTDYKMLVNGNPA
eukprot:CAMPEP_0202444012 /NCGR_PEP_ID=MMETSP1360-20130828/3171_1 /ASSEMBLY_ACC=CAM_ASM_000848 /TAXON_ID=515479 /ORGANISM="Licmophora paradoxa, Strain CCMP2313" /LENGTH=358 /DNA_ID=CAMNT_0049059877 /DNA_START=11 /DNA_END=1091 /DNA_ORIENTATION=-